MSEPETIPNGYRLRPPVEGDVTPIDRLGAVADAAQGAPPTLSETLIRRMWARPRFDLRTDAWVVEHGGDVVGYAQVWAEDPARLSGFGLVHPDHLGRGIGSALAARIERRSTELAVGEARLFSAATPQDEPGARLLSGRGYTFARRFWHMEVELPDVHSDAAAAPPHGIGLRAPDPERDLPAAHRILEEAFVDHWDHHPTTYEEFLDQNVRQDDFDPGLWVLAVDDDEPVGVLLGTAHGAKGSVDWIGVLRSHRGRGVASALLHEAFGTFRERGLTQAGLSVDSGNPTGAVSLYERMGMRVVASFDLWARSILGART